MPPDSVAMDIIFVRVPLGDAEMNGKTAEKQRRSEKAVLAANEIE